MANISGGDKLNQALNNIAGKLAKPATLQVGFFEDATYPNGTSVPMVAAIQEFGAPKVGIPPRPFFRNAIKSHSKEWPDRIKQALKNTDNDVDLALRQVGESIVGDIQKSIVDTNDPPLSPVTVMLRGMRYNNPSLVVTKRTVAEARARVAVGKTNYGAPIKPLVDTGHLLNSVRAKVTT